MRGTIEGITGGPMQGVVQLVIRTEDGELEHVTCEAAPTYRALAAAFEGAYIGQEIIYTVDDYGVLSGIEPA